MATNNAADCGISNPTPWKLGCTRRLENGPIWGKKQNHISAQIFFMIFFVFCSVSDNVNLNFKKNFTYSLTWISNKSYCVLVPILLIIIKLRFSAEHNTKWCSQILHICDENWLKSSIISNHAQTSKLKQSITKLQSCSVQVISWVSLPFRRFSPHLLPSYRNAQTQIHRYRLHRYTH